MAEQIFTTPGTSSFIVPAGVTSIVIDCIGGGGKGGNAIGGIFSSPAYAGGGAGGSYAKKTISTIPGTVYCVVVANSQNSYNNISGSTGYPSFVTQSNTVLVYAEGGQGGGHVNNQKTVKYGKYGAGSTANSIGDVLYRGGDGGGAFDTIIAGGEIDYSPCVKELPIYSGPGGGGAGFTGPGGNPSYCLYPPTGGLGNSPGGKGGDGVLKGNPGNIGSQYGGGGAGAAIRGFAFGTRYGGAGNSGYIRITWNAEELTCRPLYTSAGCCPIAVGCNVYSNPQLTTAAPDGYYWDGTKCWIVLSGVVNSTGSCGTTTSTTTTTTTATPTDYYTVTQYSCPDCSPVGNLTAYSSVNLNVGTYYSIVDGYTYLVTGTTSGPSYAVDLSSASSGASCFALCIT